MFDSLLFRPVRVSDLEQVYELAKSAQSGLSSLPKEKSLIENKIRRSIQSFSKEIKQVKNELYFFVLEDVKASRVVGTASVIGAVGIKSPFYSYHIVERTNKSPLLSHRNVYHELQFEKQADGPSEIGTLYLHPDYRQKGVGRYLSIARFMFIALHRNRFKDSVIAELRGVSDSNGHSPFWDEVMKPFFGMDFDDADLLSQKDKSFIEDCMPRQSLLLETLPKSVQKIVGKTHDNTKAAKVILESEGFTETKHVDIFDAGPKLVVPRDEIGAVSRVRLCHDYQFVNDLDDTDLYLFSDGVLANFSVYCGLARPHANDCLDISSALEPILSKKKDFYCMKLYALSISDKEKKQQKLMDVFKTWYQHLSTDQSNIRRNSYD